MSDRELAQSANDLQEVRDRSLPEAYQSHDVAQDVIEDKLDAAGYLAEHVGTDDRHGEVKFGSGPDLAIYEVDDDGERGALVAYLEIKSKRASNAEWFGRLNRRHFQEYLDVAEASDVPVFLYFAVVDMTEGMVIRDGFIEVEGGGQIEDGFMAKGNAVVCLDEADTRNFTWLLYRLDNEAGVEVAPVTFEE